ncbi:hypothetical protein HDE_08957 [Halotydeus destructor]|nr:hypothetical protein HDE_08957 [Halotydeus destructor]
MVRTRSGGESTATSRPSLVALPRGKEAQASFIRKVSAAQSLLAIAVLGGLWCGFDTQIVPRMKLDQLHVHSIADRLAFTLRHQLPGIAAILIAFFNTVLTRLVNPLALNPLSGNEHLVEVPNRILVNTFEQYILSFVNQLILATHLPEVHLKLIPLLSVTFLIGRIIYLIGYSKAPHFRSFGFTITILPTLVAFGYNVFFTYLYGYTHHLGAGVVETISIGKN